MPKEAVARQRAVEVDEDDDFRKRAQINRKEKQDRGLFKLPEGLTTFRILKTPADKQRSSPSVWLEYYVHRNVGPKKIGPIRCGLSVVDDSGSCWLCRVVDKLREQDKTLAAAEIERKKTYAIQVAVLDQETGWRGPLLWVTSSGKSSRSLSYKLETIIAAPASKGYVDHENGYNFTIDRTGTTMTDTTYGAPTRDDDRSEVPEQILKKLKPFIDVINPYDKENQKKAYYGEAEAEEDESPRRKRVQEEDDEPAKPKGKARPVPVDEEEEDSIESDPEVDNDEVDDPPPASKKASSIKDDEDEEDLQFGEDDEDEVPDESEGEDEDDEPVRPVVKGKKAKVVEAEEDTESDDEAPVKPKAKRR